MRHVGLIGCAPCRMPRLECVLGSNDLAFEIGGQRGVIRGKPYTQSSGQRDTETIRKEE